MSINVLDLFCGCGGMSWGLCQYSDDFNIVAAVDNDPVALKTYQRNHSNAQTLCMDLSSVSPHEWITRHLSENVDCLIGGPPCQGFSKNVPRNQRVLDDDRNLLVRKFLDFVDALRPQTVIMENVAEIINAFNGQFTDEILTTLNSLGYHADYHVIDAATLGVPQHRKRAFFFASLTNDVEFPQQTHYAPDDILPLFDEQKPTFVTVRDAIGDLPSLKQGQGSSPVHYPDTPQTSYQAQMRRHATLLYNHVAKKLSDKQYARLSSLKPGEGAPQLPVHLRPKSYYSGAYGRLTWDMVSRTITRWMFHTGSGRYGHPRDIRTITIREAARLQSFSDDFVFEGTFTQASSQLGNAVPPLIMTAFAPILVQHIHTTVH